MHNDLSSSQASQGDNGPLLSPPAMSTEALARRRALFKGLRRGSAALAVVVPIQTLAANTIIGGTQLCTVSGVQSHIGSHNPGGTATTCSGFSLDHYVTLANWPGYTASPPPPRATNTVDSIVFTQANAFTSVFGTGSNVGNRALLGILTQRPTSDEAVWVTALLNALLNAQSPSLGLNFPYTPSEVRAFYTGGGTTKINALAFFRNYMQTVV